MTVSSSLLYGIGEGGKKYITFPTFNRSGSYSASYIAPTLTEVEGNFISKLKFWFSGHHFSLTYKEHAACC